MKKTSKKRRGRGRPPQVESKLRAFIAANPGCSRKEIAEGIGHSYEYVLQLVSKLRAERVVLGKGRRLSMRAGRARVAV